MKFKRLILVVCVAAAFLAGVAVHAALTRRPHRGGPRFAEALNLTEEQAQRIRAIWEAAADESRQLWDEGREGIRAERDRAVRGLLSSESALLYDEILAKEAAAQEALEKERRDAFDSAEREVRKILNDEQRAKYDEMTAERRNRREGREGPPDGRRDAPPDDRRETPK